MTKGRTSRSSPAAIAAAEAQKNREDDLRIKNLLDDYTCIIEEKVPVSLSSIKFSNAFLTYKTRYTKIYP